MKQAERKHVRYGRRKAALLALAGLCVMLLAGCMYPKELRKENQVASAEYLLLVQNAVEQFQAQTGVLPIKNSDETTPYYEKYRIDFTKLQGRYLSTVPANAFENGGTAIYVIIHPDEEPAVKMIDLVAFQQTVRLQRLVDEYKTKNGGQLPGGEQVAEQFWSIDFGKLNRKPEQARSIYTPNLELPFILHSSGAVAIDYAADIMRLIDARKLQEELNEERDLRELLAEAHPYVPARSFPYQWQNDRPVPVDGHP